MAVLVAGLQGGGWAGGMDEPLAIGAQGGPVGAALAAAALLARALPHRGHMGGSAAGGMDWLGLLRSGSGRPGWAVWADAREFGASPRRTGTDAGDRAGKGRDDAQQAG